MVSDKMTEITAGTKQTVPVISFIGYSGSGKTVLLERVVRELKARGYRVAVIKHSHHNFAIDQPGKDSWRLAQAGSDAVIIAAPNKVALIESVDIEPTLSQILSLVIDKVDIVLTEGYKSSNTAKILVTGPAQQLDISYREEEILTTVSPRWTSTGEPQFDESDITMIIDLLSQEIDKTSSGRCRDISQIDDFVAQAEIQ